MKPSSPTPYPDVNEILNHLLTKAEEILQDGLLGMYIHGSLANGGFDRDSDIDIIFVTKEDLSEEVFSALQRMHIKTAALESPWAAQLEVSYFPKEALRRYDPVNNIHPHIDRGKGETLHRARHESDWVIQRYILRERGIVITGPDPKTLVDHVSQDDLRRAVAEGLPIWFDPLLEDPSEMNKRGPQSFYVLSLCRMLYTLRHGEIISKQAAANWGMANLDVHWRPLIERALVGRKQPSQDTQPEDFNGTLDMIRYTFQQIWPTSFPDVNEILKLVLTNVKEVLQDQFTGMYLYGSLSSGDFNPQTSDIDFLVVTSNLLSEQKTAALASMHEQIWASGIKWADKLEGSYIPKGMIRRHDPDGAPCPTINEGRFFMDKPGSDWIIQRHIIRECGVIVEGPNPKTLIDPVDPDDIRSAVLGILREWWFPMLDDPSWLKQHGSNYHGFIVITMCRALHALEHGTIVSKPAAVRWAQAELDPQWQPLIEKAVASQYGIHSDFMDETFEFIRFARERNRQKLTPLL